VEEGPPVVEPIREILIGVDLDPEGALTPGSQMAVRRGLSIARAMASAVTLLHANAADEYWDEDAGRFLCDDAGVSEERGHALKDTLEALRVHGVPVGLALAEERADLAIINHVMNRGADLVVVGHRSRRPGLDGLLGSISRRLVHHCPCPVWVVKEGHEGLPRSILVGTDQPPVVRGALELGVAVARASNAMLYAIHAFQLPLDVQMEGAEAVAEFDRETSAAARKSIKEFLEQIGGYPNARVFAGRSSPAAALLDTERSLGVDLTVLGTVSRGGLPGLIVGNTAERLLDRLSHSILAVKPADFVCALTE